jgi:CRP-like cAMP-binding protein
MGHSTRTLSEFGVMLRTNPLFSALEPRVIEELAKLCSTRHLHAGELLFQKGDAGDVVYGVRRGQIRIETGSRSGSRVSLTDLGAGDLFGEIALFDGHERTADAVAVEATELFALRRDDVLAYLMREPKVAIAFIELLCKRIRDVSRQMEEAVMMTLSVRLARRLIMLARDFGSEIQLSQEQLAAYVGSARESVNRQLQVWQRSGHLELKRGKIVLKNLNALAAEAERQA